MTNKEKDLLESLGEISDAYNSAMKEIENDQENFWNNLSKDDQLKVFCAVVRRLYDGELVKKGSYRYILYDVFGFGPESYSQAQDAGYIEIHNSIYTRDFDKRLLNDFCNHLGIDNPKEQIDNFFGLTR